MRCEKHNVELECLGGRSAHHSNWYCPKCEEGNDALVNEAIDHNAHAMEQKLRCVADEVANKYAPRAYKELCKKWGINEDPQSAKIFIAAFASGAHTGITVIYKSSS